ncbi:MAG TPA: T9SS type A sorting domain-containing protein [Chitinophagales bacterium]|nr:T9SS type A sorting domain-containing protein [Chitinophagales bacterium]
MKALAALCLGLMVSGSLLAQMHVKKFNTTDFRKEERIVTPLLKSNSSAIAQKHPEYGILPYNAQCTNCVELIDKRTIDSRFYIDPADEGHTYSQQSYFPMHYKLNPGDIWRTIDPRLRPVSTGVYVADRQPVPAKLDLNRKSTSLTEKGVELEFNKGLNLYFFDDNSLYTQRQAGNYSNYTVGEEGLSVKDIWPGIEMEQLFTAGQIKTNYIIAAPLQLPVSKGWMVIEDHFTLPAGFTITEEQHTYHTAEGYYRGNYEIRNAKGEVQFTYEKPVYLDANVLGMPGVYNLLQNGNDYTLQMLIPVEWLAKPDNRYPLLIDPVVSGSTKIGDFTQTGLPSASMGFTSMALGACPYTMNVQVPGKSELTKAYVEVEYSLTYDNMCGTPPLPPPFCTFSQVSMEVQCDACSTSTGPLTCNPANPPFTGTCTTDSNLVPGANAILVNSFVPNYLSCYAPQCADYNIGFTLNNRDSICGDQCGYLCARGNMWRMTIEANRVDAVATIDPLIDCPGDPFTITATPAGGVPPFTYLYSTDGGVSYNTSTNDSWVLFPQNTNTVSIIAIDVCGDSSEINEVTATVHARPVITISNDTLYATIADTYQWYLNGNLIPGATGSSYYPTQPGQYSVQVTGSFNCTSTSDVFYYQVSGISQTGAGRLTVIPNPSDGNFIIKCDALAAGENISLRIVDISGKLIEARINIPVGNTKSYAYHPFGVLASGTYYLELTAGGKVYREKMLVVK